MALKYCQPLQAVSVFGKVKFFVSHRLNFFSFGLLLSFAAFIFRPDIFIFDVLVEEITPLPLTQ